MTSYEKFTALCKLRKVTPTAALLSSGLSRSLGSKWKKSASFTPNTDSIQKLCRYFGVSADYFLHDDPDVFGYLQEPKEFAVLLRAGIAMTPEQRTTVVRFAQFLYPEAFHEV